MQAYDRVLLLPLSRSSESPVDMMAEFPDAYRPFLRIFVPFVVALFLGTVLQG